MCGDARSARLRRAKRRSARWLALPGACARRSRRKVERLKRSVRAVDDGFSATCAAKREPCMTAAERRRAADLETCRLLERAAV